MAKHFLSNSLMCSANSSINTSCSLISVNLSTCHTLPPNNVVSVIDFSCDTWMCSVAKFSLSLSLSSSASALRSGPVRFFCPFGFEPRPDRFFIFQKSTKNRTGPYRTSSLQFILVTEPVLTGFRPNPVRTGLYYIKWVLCIYNYYIIKWNL